MDSNDIKQVRRDCTRALIGHNPKRPQQILTELAATTDPDLAGDHYGQGTVIADFENEIATLLARILTTGRC